MEAIYPTWQHIIVNNSVRNEGGVGGLPPITTQDPAICAFQGGPG